MVANIDDVLDQNVTGVFVTGGVPVPVEMPQIDTGVMVPIIRSRDSGPAFLGQRNSIGILSEFRIAYSSRFIELRTTAFTCWVEAECAERSHTQFSTDNPGTLAKCRMLLVTSVHLRATACAAIRTSNSLRERILP